jgi:hypothetical protein
MAQSTRLDYPLKGGPHREVAGHAPVLTPEEARQGVVSGRVRLILAVSLILAALAFVVVYIAI